jgi:hypothetical protein
VAAYKATAVAAPLWPILVPGSKEQCWSAYCAARNRKTLAFNRETLATQFNVGKLHNLAIPAQAKYVAVRKNRCAASVQGWLDARRSSIHFARQRTLVADAIEAVRQIAHTQMGSIRMQPCFL